MMVKKGWESMYGYTTFMSFMDVNGNIYVTFYKGQKDTPERGEDLLLTGTVKEHDERDGVKQTCINRIAWEKIILK
jgi:hypothetical protein